MYNRENSRFYHKKIEAQIQKNKYILKIELSDLKNHDEHLYEKFISNPMEILKVIEEGIKIYVKEKKEEFSNAKDIDWQVSLISDENSKKIRDINSNMVSKIFVINGIIISTTKPYIKASKLKLRCKNCLTTRVI